VPTFISPRRGRLFSLTTFLMPPIGFLDTGPLGLLAHNRAARRIQIRAWLLSELTAGAAITISEVADYEFAAS
jgi:hypothetical protein